MILLSIFVSHTTYALKLTIDQDELIRLLRNRERKGFDILYDTYSGALLGVIMQMVTPRETAEDVLQEAFVKIWKYVDSFDPAKASLYTWMLNITRNTALDMIKSKGYRKAAQNQSLDNVVYNNHAREPAPVTSASSPDLRDVLGMLDPDKKALISQAYFEGYTQAEIAENMGIPLGTVKTRMRNALQKLRDFLKD